MIRFFVACVVMWLGLVGTAARADDGEVPLTPGLIEGVAVVGNKVSIDPTRWTFVVEGNSLKLSPRKKKPNNPDVPVLRCKCSYGPSNCTMTASGGDARCEGGDCCGFVVIFVPEPQVRLPAPKRADRTVAAR